MININLNIDDLFRYSEELLLIVDQHRNIIYLNNKAASFFGQASSLTEIEHFFSFDVCILDKKSIADYTPLKEAFLSKETFRAEILLQTGREEYKKFNLRSIKNNENKY